MIAIDTNVLLRLVIRDDPEQAELARDLMASAGPDTRAFVSREVLAEFIWVLRQGFGLSRPQIAEAVTALMENGALELETSEDLAVCLERYRVSADFADLMILAAARRAGCETLYTFDRRLGREDGVTLLETS